MAPFALVISGSPVGGDPALIERLAQQASFILAVDSGANALLATGVTPNLLLGDFDSIDPKTLECFKAKGVELETHNPYKDATDIELALLRARQQGYTSLVITNALGGRLDHELASLGCFAHASQQGATVAVVEPDTTCLFLNADAVSNYDTPTNSTTNAPTSNPVVAKGDNQEADSQEDSRIKGDNQAGDSQVGDSQADGRQESYYQKGGSQEADSQANNSQKGDRNAGDTRSYLRIEAIEQQMPPYISLIPWAGDAIVSIIGVEWELDHATLKPAGTLGVSNVPKGNHVEITVHQGTVIVVLINPQASKPVSQ